MNATTDRADIFALRDAFHKTTAALLTNGHARDILSELKAAGFVLARQEGSAEDDGAAMRHTLSVQATDKSARAEGVAALQQQQDVADLIAWHTRERHAWLNVRASNEPGYTEQKAKFHETAVATLRGLHA